MNPSANRVIGIWLLCGVLMIYVQIIVGGITRLTGSGLSITKWEVITGTIPPLNTDQWVQEFDKYKATPQFEQINQGMSLQEFKFIYFWEYFHRLWARLMGFVFAIPLFIFFIKGWVSKALAKQLTGVFILAAVVASFGWIMVKSGLIDRPWVSPYKLTIHLSLALILYAYVLWLALAQLFKHGFVSNAPARKFSGLILVLLSFQLVIGGLMSGMKAGLFYPTFPDMNGAFIPEILFSFENWGIDAFVNYDQNGFAVALVHFVHRIVAYLLGILILVFFFKLRSLASNAFLRSAIYALPVVVFSQILLGILVVLNSLGNVPVALGVIHQGVAILLLSVMIIIHYFLRSHPVQAR